MGNNFGTLTACYASGSVNGENYIGGLVGFNGSTINNCYANALVVGESYTGGLVGRNVLGFIISSFWDVETSGQTGSGGGKGLATDQMKTMSIYQNACWAEKGWVMQDGIDYPHLSWEGTSGMPIPSPQTIPLVGSGTEEDPYLVSTAEEFALLSWYGGVLDKQIRLTANLDLSEVLLYPIGDLGPFTGVFDGDDYKIANAIIHYPDSDFIAVFSDIGTFDARGQIQNLGLENVHVTGRYNVGSLVGMNFFGSITSCYTTGFINGKSFVGGLVGENYYSETIARSFTICFVNGTDNYTGGVVGTNKGIITDCYANSTISGYAYVGGLAGMNVYSGAITDCFATGSVSGFHSIGGLVGRNEYAGTISSSYASGAVDGTNSMVGGLVGWNSYRITNCYAISPVNGVNYVGGLVGKNVSGGIITGCYTTGSINGISLVGGLIGYNSGSITRCFWDIETTGQMGSTGGTGKATAEMMTLSTFTGAGWDFTEGDGDGAEWMMVREGEDYPRLAWQEVYGGDIAGRYGVGLEDLLEVAGNWLEEGCPAGCEEADINGDGRVDLEDFAILAGNWLKS